MTTKVDIHIAQSLLILNSSCCLCNGWCVFNSSQPTNRWQLASNHLTFAQPFVTCSWVNNTISTLSSIYGLLICMISWTQVELWFIEQSINLGWVNYCENIALTQALVVVPPQNWLLTHQAKTNFTVNYFLGQQNRRPYIRKDLKKILEKTSQPWRGSLLPKPFTYSPSIPSSDHMDQNWLQSYLLLNLEYFDNSIVFTSSQQN